MRIKGLLFRTIIIEDFHLKHCMDKVHTDPKSTGETVEKASKYILGGDAEKNDLTECATINDLTITKGRETPKNQVLTILKGFSTVSEGILGKWVGGFTYESSLTGIILG